MTIQNNLISDLIEDNKSNYLNYENIILLKMIIQKIF